MKSATGDKPRLILADDNIRNTGGHYFELANLLLGGAGELGYQGILATAANFDERLASRPTFELVPTFRSRRLVHWSLGVDGSSRFRRDISGKSIGGRPLANAWINLVDRFRPRRCPETMLRQWAEDLAGLLTRLKPRGADSLLISTGDDFAMLALAAAMQRCDVPPIRIDVIFHFALYETSQSDRKERLRQIGQQVESAAQMLAPHQVHLHATTPTLAAQFRDTQSQCPIRAIPYPTRPRPINEQRSGQPWKAVLAGLPRPEKGKAAIFQLLSDIEQPLLRTRQFRLSMQMRSKRWRGLIPQSLHGDFERAAAGSNSQPLEIMINNLSTEQYHDWLDTADVGLFLYEPDRYVARCSGVLLEMLVRGVPVIVPDRCWLADQIRLAGGDGSIGFIYKDRSHIADLMSLFARGHDGIRKRSIEYAAKIIQRHSGKNTLLEMGLPAINHQDRQVA